MKNLSYKYHSYIHRGYTLRKIIVFFTFSFFIFHSWLSAEQIGTWKVYPSYTIATYNIPVGQRIYSLMDGKLMAYDTEDGSITTFDWMEQYMKDKLSTCLFAQPLQEGEKGRN